MENKNKEKEQGIYKFHFDCGRGGTLYGLFIAKVQDMKNLVKSKKEVYFGEVAGKHSEVYGSVDKTDFTLVSIKEEDVEVVERLNLETGYNPFDYLSEENEGE